MSETSFLFRFDGAPGNESFVTSWHQRHPDGVPYSGTSITVGDWTPDLLEVTIADDASSINLTLIELEATEKRAREHCRVYLPERSAALLDQFVRYLDTVLSRCRRITDPRLAAFERLKQLLVSNTTTRIQTAGALRTAADFVEVFLLMDQANSPNPSRAPTQTDSPATFAFRGQQVFSRAELDALRRVVRTLHAVVIGKDHSGGTIDNFLSKRNPLKDVLRDKSTEYGALSSLVTLTEKSGGTVDCESILRELAGLFASAGKQIECDRIRRWIEDFHPIASGFRKHQPMKELFEEARCVVAK